jgi:hypothetical protein
MKFGSRNDEGNVLNDFQTLVSWAEGYIRDHVEPDFHVGPADDHQLQRWFIVPRNPYANVYLHRFLRSDDDRALHDHPWDNTSLILSGHYLEHLQDGHTVTRFTGDIVHRKAIEAHRVELVDGPVVTLFTTGPIVRDWGFYCPQGWRPWWEFVTTTAGGNQHGRGCG